MQEVHILSKDGPINTAILSAAIAFCSALLGAPPSVFKSGLHVEAGRSPYLYWLKYQGVDDLDLSPLIEEALGVVAPGINVIISESEPRKRAG